MRLLTVCRRSLVTDDGTGICIEEFLDLVLDPRNDEGIEEGDHRRDEQRTENDRDNDFDSLADVEVTVFIGNRGLDGVLQGTALEIGLGGKGVDGVLDVFHNV